MWDILFVLIKVFRLNILHIDRGIYIMKKILASLLTVFLFGMNFLPALAVESSKTVKDVANNYWAKSSIDYVLNNGIMKTDEKGNFNPEKSLTRVEFVQALLKILSDDTDLVILDVMMPRMDGYALTQALRSQSAVPILILSAKGQDSEKILGLNLGADDYLTKPFNPLEVVARVRALLRRAGRAGEAEVLQVRELTLDTLSFQLTKNGEPITLTPMEYKILAQLMRAPGRIFTKVQLYEGTSGEFFESDDNTMMVHISKLREKIEDDPRRPAYIVTVRGLGYKLEK